MMTRWGCGRCGFVAWTADRSEMRDVVGSHLLAHTPDAVSRSDFRTSWDCPYCSTEKTAYDGDSVVEEFESHLYEHAADGLDDGVHVADRFSWDGTVHVAAPVDGPGADALRVHFHGNADLVIAVTADPDRFVRLLDAELGAWPGRTVVVSSEPYSFETDAPDGPDDGSVEIVEIDPRLGAEELGETVSRIIDANHAAGDTLSVEVSVFREIVRSFDVQTACSFIRMLSARLDDTGGALQLYADADADANVSTVLNFLDDEIDLRLAAEDERFVRTT
ncbi:hypothetical protein [Halorubrum sp. Boch-26]|uniref:DUF7504 family protein n=1 Tax=Halorubrum sp. Boch-26 TaxID=2994426 RepID=UPI002815DC22|nr:hypothetical protein [Halorubrum sp. Boch-26]